MNSRLQGWLRQPTTIHGIGVIVATVAGIGTYVATRSPVMAAGLAGSTFGVIAAMLNDSNADTARIEALVTDVATAIASRHVAAMLPQLVADASKALESAAPAGATPAPQVKS